MTQQAPAPHIWAMLCGPCHDQDQMGNGEGNMEVGLKRESWKVKALSFTPVVITEKLVFCVVGTGEEVMMPFLIVLTAGKS